METMNRFGVGEASPPRHYSRDATMAQVADKPLFLSVVAVFLVLVVFSLALRLYACRKRSARIGVDDALAMTAGISSLVLSLTAIVGFTKGIFVDFPPSTWTLHKLVEERIVVYLSQLFYIASVASAKLSVLALYRRVFASIRTPIAIWLLITITILWFIIFFFLTLFQGTPPGCQWRISPVNDGVGYPCTYLIDPFLLYITSSASDVALDIFILSIPPFYIRRLHMPTGRRSAIAAIFGAGVICVVASVARLAYSVDYLSSIQVQNDDLYYDSNAELWMLWSAVEASISTISASLPCYGPLIPWGALDRLGLQVGRRVTKASTAVKNTFRQNPLLDRTDVRIEREAMRISSSETISAQWTETNRNENTSPKADRVSSDPRSGSGDFELRETEAADRV